MNLNEVKDFKNYAINHRGISGLNMHRFESRMNKAVAPIPNMGMVTVPNMMTPNIIEERQMNVAVMDVFSRLMLERIIFLGTNIDDMVANIIVAQILYLDSVDSNKDIQMYINSGGGSVTSGLAIYSTMQIAKSPVSTLVSGMAASMAFILAISGEKGKRFALKHSRLMQHQPMTGVQGQASDIEITHNEIQKYKKELYTIISERTGQSYKKIEKDADRDFWLDCTQAKAYGAIDKIIG